MISPSAGLTATASEDPAAALRRRLEARFALRTDAIDTGHGTLRVTRLRDADRLADAADLNDPDERFPYWAEIWPSSVALGGAVLQRADEFRGREVFELGCGLGLVGLAAAAAGARVLSTDYDRDAVTFARLNALENGLQGVCHAVMDWRALAVRRRFACVLAADVLYEGRFLVPVARALGALLAPGGSALVAEPGREVAAAFFDMLRDDGWQVRGESVTPIRLDGIVSRVEIVRLMAPGEPGRA